MSTAENDIDLTPETRIIKKHRTRNFTIIDNSCINDTKLPGEALALLVYVMSKPSDWEIIMKDVAKRFSIGRDKTYNLIRKLIELGYMKRIVLRNSDGSLGKTSILASDEPVFILGSANDKQPLTENQEVVTEEKADKQPLPEKPDTVNQEVDSLYTNKDIYKENNNNKSISNPIGACATPDSGEVTNIYPDKSVVVFFMKKIEGSGVTEPTLISWLRKHGEEYVSEKIRIYQSKGAIANPGGFLSSAIRFDWKDGTTKASAHTGKKEPTVTYPTLEENRTWFNQLSDNEKNGLEQLALIKQPTFKQMLDISNPKLTVLDSQFPKSFLFKLLMELVGRSGR